MQIFHYSENNPLTIKLMWGIIQVEVTWLSDKGSKECVAGLWMNRLPVRQPKGFPKYVTRRPPYVGLGQICFAAVFSS